jgi:hypothetical protein
MDEESTAIVATNGLLLLIPQEWESRVLCKGHEILLLAENG